MRRELKVLVPCSSRRSNNVSAVVPMRRELKAGGLNGALCEDCRFSSCPDEEGTESCVLFDELLRRA